MTVALKTPKNVGALISVDNAPVDATLKSNFSMYIQGMRRILDAGVTKQAEADHIMESYEEVRSIGNAKYFASKC